MIISYHGISPQHTISKVALGVVDAGRSKTSSMSMGYMTVRVQPEEPIRSNAYALQAVREALTPTANLAPATRTSRLGRSHRHIARWRLWPGGRQLPMSVCAATGRSRSEADAVDVRFRGSCWHI
jgi:hypothetical protein